MPLIITRWHSQVCYKKDHVIAYLTGYVHFMYVPSILCTISFVDRANVAGIFPYIWQILYAGGEIVQQYKATEHLWSYAIHLLWFCGYWKNKNIHHAPHCSAREIILKIARQLSDTLHMSV